LSPTDAKQSLLDEKEIKKSVILLQAHISHQKITFFLDIVTTKLYCIFVQVLTDDNFRISFTILFKINITKPDNHVENA